MKHISALCGHNFWIYNVKRDGAYNRLTTGLWRANWATYWHLMAPAPGKHTVDVTNSQRVVLLIRLIPEIYFVASHAVTRTLRAEHEI